MVTKTESNKWAFHIQLAEARKRYGHTQHQAGLVIGIDGSTFSKLERGVYPHPTDKWMKKLRGYINDSWTYVKDSNTEETISIIKYAENTTIETPHTKQDFNPYQLLSYIMKILSKKKVIMRHSTYGGVKTTTCYLEDKDD